MFSPWLIACVGHLPVLGPFATPSEQNNIFAHLYFFSNLPGLSRTKIPGLKSRRTLDTYY